MKWIFSIIGGLVGYGLTDSLVWAGIGAAAGFAFFSMLIAIVFAVAVYFAGN